MYKINLFPFDLYSTFQNLSPHSRRFIARIKSTTTSKNVFKHTIKLFLKSHKSYSQESPISLLRSQAGLPEEGILKLWSHHGESPVSSPNPASSFTCRSLRRSQCPCRKCCLEECKSPDGLDPGKSI